jgi:hypothetical protein
MKITLNLDFSIPIWKFFFGPNINIPYKFTHNGKTYENGITIIHFACYMMGSTYFLNLLKKSIKKYPNPILCTPDIETLNYLKKNIFNCQIILAGHNAFIDEDFFKIDNNIEKKYDLIINSSFAKLKNVSLTENINNIIHIGYFYDGIEPQDEYIPKNGYCPNFKDNLRDRNNYERVANDDVVKYIQESKIGGIFSTCEGCCYSSGQYLLCGLPVISVHCSGGRQHWYNNYNSVLCENNNKSVENAFEEAIEKLNNGYFDPVKIRQMHLDEMDIQRNNLTTAVMNIFNGVVYQKDRPDFYTLKNYLKYYHSAVLPGQNMGKKQQEDELLALEVLSKI